MRIFLKKATLTFPNNMTLKIGFPNKQSEKVTVRTEEKPYSQICSFLCNGSYTHDTEAVTWRNYA